MDHLVQHIAEGDNNTESYALPGIWEFAVANNDNVTSFGELAGSIEMSNGNVMNREHDPMIMGHCTFKKLRQNAHNGNANATIINNESDDKRTNTTRVNEHGETKQGERNCGDAREKTAKPPEPPKQDYIHVRARRGQATDSHSLAERARREKISERMKILQDLVPGCNKVIGKALVLDEIINYIQSLQRQVEFLSLKLESINSRVPPGIEGFPSKEFSQQAAFDASSLGFSSQEARGYSGRPPEWLHMQLGGGFERTS